MSSRRKTMIPSSKIQRQLIGIACAQLGIDKPTKEDMLMERFGKTSTCDISRQQAEEFLRELGTKGFKTTRRPGKPDIKRQGADKKAMMEKVEAYLAEAGRPWAYVHGMAKKMFKRDRVEWCDAGQLHRIIAALEYDARRHGRGRM